MKNILVAALLVSALTGPAIADGSADAGQKLFKKCQACHAVGDGARNKVGPELNNVFGRTAGGLESYGRKYSKAMIKAGEDGLVWNEETMAEFLIKPKKYLKGTKMSFAGFKKEQDIKNMEAYLLTFSPDYVAHEEGDDTNNNTDPQETKS